MLTFYSDTFKTLDGEDKGERILEMIMGRVTERKNEGWIFS